MNRILFGLIISVFVAEGNLTCCEGNKLTETLCGNHWLQTINSVLDKTKILQQESNKCHETQKNSIIERLEIMELKLATILEEKKQHIDSKAAEIRNNTSNLAYIEQQLEKKLNEKLDAISKTFESKENANIKSILDKFDAVDKNVNEQIGSVMKKINDSDNLILSTITKCGAFNDLVPSVPHPLFKPIGSKFYYIEHENKMNWLKAGNKCRVLGGHLVSFQNQEEFDAVRTQLKPGTDYWIDLNDLDTEGEFVSIVTGRKPRFTNWHNNEPNNSKATEHCGNILYYNQKHLMNDDTCSYESGFICELAKKTK